MYNQMKSKSNSSASADSKRSFTKTPLTKTVVEADVHESGNFILNKFLHDSNRLMDENAQTKKPIPTPRKLKLSKHLSSEGSKSNEEIPSNSCSSTSTEAPNLARKTSIPNSLVEERILVDDPSTKVIYENVKSNRARKVKINEDTIETKIDASNYDYKQITGITVHRTDRLKLDSFVVHPLVKVHIVNMNTGEYLLKSDSKRSVVFYYENKNIPYIIPTLTAPFSFYKLRLTSPQWEETILLNEDINHIVDKATIVFFEIVDFVNYAVIVSTADKKGLSQGWHKIAWAFLKLVAKNGEKNVNETIRLQLFYPEKYKKVGPQFCPMFSWWKGKKLKKYPSTLYVTVNALEPPQEVLETLRSKTPMQAETGSTKSVHSIENPKTTPERVRQKSEPIPVPAEEPAPTWGRLKHQTCKIPNTWLEDLPSFEEGCFVMKFSCNGLYLACAVLIDATYCVVVYSVLNWTEFYRYSVHEGLIYRIVWTPDDKYIITSSADFTTSVWNFADRALVDMLEHPSYVYACDVDKHGCIATGCYDMIVRIWNNLNESSYQLSHQLKGHRGYVTSVCFSRKFDLLYSSDSLGVVIEWEKTSEDWTLRREFSWMNLNGIIINHILVHKRERRLLVYARDGSLNIIDLKTRNTLQYLQRPYNLRFRSLCCFSACGTYIFSAAESGRVNVWNVDLGRLIASYAPYSMLFPKNVTVHCVEFHPHDNILAMSHYGHPFPIVVAKHNSNSDPKNRLGFDVPHIDTELTEHQLATVKSKKSKKNFSGQKFKSPKINVVMEKMNNINDS